MPTLSASPGYTHYLGIDPGVNGGLVRLISYSISRAELTRARIETTPMPATERDRWLWFRNLALDLPPEDQIAAYIEWIHPAIFGVGKSSMAKLYGSYMQLRGFLHAANIPFEDVKPVVWQRELSISPRKKTEGPTQWKNRLKAKAQELFPKVKITLKTADAILIAEYGRRLRRGLLG